MPHKLRTKPLGLTMPQRVRTRTLGPGEALPHSPRQEEKQKPDDSEETPPSPTLPPLGELHPKPWHQTCFHPHPLTWTKPKQHHPGAGRDAGGWSRTLARSGAPTAPHPRPPRLRPARPAADSWWEAAFPAHSDKFLAVRAALQPPRPRRGKLPWKEED